MVQTSSASIIKPMRCYVCVCVCVYTCVCLCECVCVSTHPEGLICAYVVITKNPTNQRERGLTGDLFSVGTTRHRDRGVRLK